MCPASGSATAARGPGDLDHVDHRVLPETRHPDLWLASLVPVQDRLKKGALLPWLL